MAGWMWLRCIFGPHLQRIHRSPDQSRPDGRAARRVRLLVVFCMWMSDAECENEAFSSLRVSVSQSGSRKFEVFVIETPLSSRWVTGVHGKWMDVWNGSRIDAVKSQNSCWFLCMFLPASAHVSRAAHVDDIDLVLLTLAKRELCPELTRTCFGREQLQWAYPVLIWMILHQNAILCMDFSWIANASLVDAHLMIWKPGCGYEQGWNYQPWSIERHSDNIIGWVSVV